jgi:hypothetical protein
MRALALFSPGLDPVLERGEGDKHPMVAPEMPTGAAIREAIFDH